MILHPINLVQVTGGLPMLFTRLEEYGPSLIYWSNMKERSFVLYVYAAWCHCSIRLL